MRIPAERRFIIDQDTIAIIGVIISDDPTDTQKRFVVAIHHIPSLSVVNIDANDAVSATSYKGTEGQQKLDAILSTPSLRKQMHDFLVAYIKK